MTANDRLKTAQSLRKQGRVEEALGVLRQGLRDGSFDAEGVERAGRFILKELEAGAAGVDKPVHILLLGQCTTSWLVPSLTAAAWGQGTAALVTEGGFDNVMQELAALPARGQGPDVIALLPWSARLLLNTSSGEAEAEARVADEAAFWRSAWELVARSGARVLQIGYDWVTPGPLGYHLGGQPGGPLDLVRRVNAELRRNLPPGAYFVDLEAVSGEAGRSSFYDMRRYHWTKQPFSESGVRLLAEHLWAGTRALTTGPKKVLVLDLDNTLWGGVVGETGPLGIALGDSVEGEAFTAFQRYVKGLAARGVVLGVASKNNPDDAREPFEKNPEMILGLDDFGAWEANWEPKGSTISRMAETLNLGIDSFVFFDDNPAEREQVRQALPEVSVVEVPEEPAAYVRALQEALCFEATSLTGEDRTRAMQYALERKRRELQQSFTTMDDYLRSLEMTGDARPIDEADLLRAVQLLAKTNQFNLTTRRHSAEEVAAQIARPRAVHLTLRVRDRFGDHGLVALVLAVPDDTRPDHLRIDTFLMSCRVIARTVEQFLFARLLERAKALGYRSIVGEFIPTKKNALVSQFYPGLGFSRVEDGASSVVKYALDVAESTSPTTFVTAVAER